MALVSLAGNAGTAQLPVGGRLIDAILELGRPLPLACGGQGICATCHCQVVEGADLLERPGERELRTLARLDGRTSQSRLACQSRLRSDGAVLRLELPDSTFVQSTQDLFDLVGKRARRPVRHPSDGRILVPSGKIITRSTVVQLGDLDFDLTTLRATSALRRSS